MSLSSSPPRSSLAPSSPPPPAVSRGLEQSQERHVPKKRSISDAVEDDQGEAASTGPDGDPMSPRIVNDGGTDGKGNENPSKKRKLTAAEKEERERERVRRELEKMEKEKEKAEKKAVLEEKKKALEEAKRKKDEEKRKKEEEKAEAQRKKDEEKRKRDQEKAKKERAQTRLSAFFAKPKGESSSQSAPQIHNVPDRPSGKEDGGFTEAQHEADAKQPSDYERYFQPFFVKQHVTLAPQTAFVRDEEYKEYIKKKLDAILANTERSLSHFVNPDNNNKEDIIAPIRGITGEEMADLLHLPRHKRVRRGQIPKYTVKQLLELINTSESEISTSSSASANHKSPNYYLALLNALPRKHLHFATDIRPPYSGTFTRIPPENSGLRKGRNPFQPVLPNVDYDYDSEAEWVAPEEGEEEDGEDLLSELGDEEDEEDIEDEDEMEEFLDDEDDGVKRRAGALCPLLPFSSGLCWEDGRGRNEKKELQGLKLGILLDGVSGPINPFSEHYWLPPPKAPCSSVGSSLGNPLMSTFLSTPSATTTLLPHRPAHNLVNSIATSQTPKKLIGPEDLDAFKKAVDGSDMTKAGLVELLKKQFPKASKDAIRATLGKVAVRMGGKEADKRWVLRT